MGKVFLIFWMTLATTMSFCQVGIGTTTPSSASMLEVNSTSDDGATYRGFMPPRVPNVAARNLMNPTAADAGLMVYLSSSGCLQFWTGSIWENIKCSTEAPNPPTLLATQNFEIIPANHNLNVSGIIETNYHTGNGLFPPSPKYVSPDRGYGVNNGNTVLTFGPIDASLFTFVEIKFHLASFSTNDIQGADAPDSVTLNVSTDGTSYTPEIKILGYNNSIWGFNDANIASSNYMGTGTPTIFQSTGNFDSGIGNVLLKNIPASSNILFQIRLANDRPDELWIIDDVEVFGL